MAPEIVIALAIGFTSGFAAAVTMLLLWMRGVSP